MRVGQLSDPYNQGEQDDDVEIMVSGLPSDDEPFGAPEIDELDDEMADLIADDFHRFYHEHRVLGSEAQAFRLGLVRATQAVIARSLDLIGVDAPERM